MTTAPSGTTLGTIRMRLVYFQHHDTVDVTPEPVWLIEPVTPADLARVFHQIDLLVDYARLLATATTETLLITRSAPREGHPRPEAVAYEYTQVLWKDLRELSKRMQDEGRDDMAVAIGRLMIAHAAHFPVRDLGNFPLLVGPDDDVTVTALRMGSPLEVLVEIPSALWPVLALGLLTLTERITTMPVRIARKRKEELLKSAILDRQTTLVNDGRADVLAQLLIQEGPHRDARAPDEVLFLDPEDPEDELELVSPPASP